MYELNLMQHILTKLNETLTSSREYRGGIFGFQDDSGSFKVLDVNGYEVTSKDIFIVNFADIDNEVEPIPETVIVNYNFFINILIPVEHINEFSKSIYDFRFDNNAKIFSIPNGNDILNTIFKIDFANKEAETIDTGSRTYIEFSLEIATTGGADVHFGNETLFEIKEIITESETIYFKYSTMTALGVRISKQEYDLLLINLPENTAVDSFVGKDDDHFEETRIIAISSEPFDLFVVVSMFMPIRKLIVRDDFQGLSTSPVQRKGDTTATSTDRSDSWGTQITVIADFQDILHRNIIEQIASRKKRKYTLKITVPTFEPYFKPIILDSVAQASPLGGLISLTATVKEILP